MSINELNELAGRIEGVGRVVMELVARLEDAGMIDGQRFTDDLRGSVKPRNENDLLMLSAMRSLNRASDAIDEARQWRKFRRQIGETSRRRA